MQRQSVWRYCWFIGGTDHRNLGDHLICESMKAFISDIDPCIRIQEVALGRYFQEKEYLVKKILKDDVLLFGGGGFLGNMWPNGDIIRRDAFRTWPENRKIVFPQCCWFSDDEEGKSELRESEQLYKGDNVLLALRDKVSYEFAVRHFSCRLFLVPDIALYSIYGQNMLIPDLERQRHGVRLILRNDKESALTNEMKDRLHEILSGYFPEIEERDNMASQSCDENTRLSVLKEALGAIASRKLVVTDRLHGMIECAVSGTPCIVLNLNRQYHKIGASYPWVKELPYIRMVESIDEVAPCLARLDLSKKYEYPVQKQRQLYSDFMESVRTRLTKNQDSREDLLIMVSVIIPAYNAEDYLSECLDSVTAQTLKEIEIICIDDGSTDATLQILEGYAKNDCRIKIIHQENGGLSCARNVGMKQVSGKYLVFLDSDDMLQQNALELLLQKADALNLDMLFYNLVPFCADPALKDAEEHYEKYYQRNGQYDLIYTGLEIQELMVRNNDYKPAACGYLLNSEFIKRQNLTFIPGIQHEDNAFTFRASTLAMRVSLLSCALYKRRIHNGSIMQTKKSFRNVYGYLVSMIDMMKAAEENQNIEGSTTAQKTLISSVAKNAVFIWNGLTKDEQEKWRLLSEEEKTAFRFCFLEYSKVDEVHFKLQQAYEEKSRLNAKLQKTYREKSEINAKLQRTYAEKSERGNQIKELTKELKETQMKLKETQQRLDLIEKSKSWRMISAVRGLSGLYKRPEENKDV